MARYRVIFTACLDPERYPEVDLSNEEVATLSSKHILLTVHGDIVPLVNVAMLELIS